MASMDLLYETFNLYLNKAKSCYKQGDMNLAKKYYRLAAEQMLKIAQESEGELQKVRFDRAKNLIDFAETVDAPEKKALRQDDEDVHSVDVKQLEKISLEQALADLQKLEGLECIKNQVKDWIDQIKVFKLRKERGMFVPDMSYHMVFTGNPGTGKTTVARIMAQVYRALGIISTGQLVEVARGDLVAGYVGQTAIKTQEVVKKAIGGVLFVDEAYSLSSGGDRDYGQEAIDTLIKLMEDNRNNLVVIVAGYNELMENFIDSNPGLKSRFKHYLNFSDYNGEQLYKIFCHMCNANQYFMGDGVKETMLRYFTELYERRNSTFGNARDVRNLFEKIVTLQSRRLASSSILTDNEMQMITLSDLPLDVLFYNDHKVESFPLNSEERMIKTVDGEKNNVSQIKTPEEFVLESSREKTYEFQFEWDKLPKITFNDVAGFEQVKDTVAVKVLLPLKNPQAFEGYEKKNGGGLLLYGPPGTGKTMIAAAIANEIGAKFCSVKPSDLLQQGAGQSEKAVRDLFAQAREFPCSVIYFDEMDALTPKNTRSQYAKQLRSELLAQLQGVESYGKQTGNILFLIAATNKPWDIDSAFIRPGRFGTRIFVGLPNAETRRFIIDGRIEKINKNGLVHIDESIVIDEIIEKTNGYNCSDITNLLDKVEELSIIRGIKQGRKTITKEDFNTAISEIRSSVQKEDIEKLLNWTADNN